MINLEFELKTKVNGTHLIGEIEDNHFSIFEFFSFENPVVILENSLVLNKEELKLLIHELELVHEEMKKERLDILK